MENKKSRLKARDKVIVAFLVCVIAIIAVFYLGTRNILEKKDAVASENKTLTAEKNELEGYYQRKPELEKELKKKESDSNYILAKYPDKDTLENDLLYIINILKQGKAFGMSKFTRRDVGGFYTFVDKSGKEDSSLGMINATSIEVDIDVTYPYLKNLIEEINQKCDVRVKIEEVNLDKDEENGGLSGTAKLTLYTGYNITKYKDPDFKLKTGKNNVFIPEKE